MTDMANTTQHTQWTKPPGGRRYEAILPMLGVIQVVKQNTAAGGPRWVATLQNIRNERRVLAKGDYLAPVKRDAIRAAEGLMPA